MLDGHNPKPLLQQAHFTLVTLAILHRLWTDVVEDVIKRGWVFYDSRGDRCRMTLILQRSLRWTDVDWFLFYYSPLAWTDVELHNLTSVV